MVVLATAHSSRPVIWGVILICVGLLHLAFRRYYARRNAAVETARRETAIAPFRRRWLGLTGERSNLLWTTTVSSLMVLGGVVLLALSL